MKGRIFILVMLMSVSVVFGQRYQHVIDYGALHSKPITVTFTASSDTNKYVWVQLPTKKDTARADTLKPSESTTTAGFVVGQTALWDGYAEVNIKITNTDLATDSLCVKCWALDENGAKITNDWVYLDFGTPPDWSTAQQILSWTTATIYRASISQAFGRGTSGFLFEVDMNDATASHTGAFIFKLYL